MSVSLQRALLLLEQSRHDLAEQELRRYVAAEPNDPLAHALLGLCLAERKAFKEATEAAQTAVRLAPDLALAHRAVASILNDRQHHDEASRAIEEAIRLDPEDAASFSLLAQIRLNQRRWRDALAAAEQGLALDPEHVDCTNLRAIALVQLGRKAEAGETIEAALAREPENAVTHANQGWTSLHEDDHTRALEHFREALRLDPQLEWARSGLVEALKARYPLYGLLLRYTLWMSRLSRRTQWGVLIAGYLGVRFLRGLAATSPALALVIYPLIVVYALFAFLTWTAEPLFNLLLRLNRFGRYALSPDEVVASNWVGACLLAAAGAGVGYAVTQNGALLFAAFITGLLVILVAGTFHCSPGWPRKVMGAYTGAVALALLVGSGLLLMAPPGQEEAALTGAGYAFFAIAAVGAFAGTWLGNFLTTVRPKH